MQKLLFLVIGYLCFFNIVIAQNLVPNHSFEAVDSCIISIAHIPSDWTSATTLGTPDTYHICTNSNTLRPPHILACDSMPPHSGDAFIGLLTYGNFPKEYLQMKLEKPLEKGKIYYLEFFVAPKRDCNGFEDYTDAIGLAFSNEELLVNIPFGDDEPLELVPALENESGVINQLSVWTKVSGCYNAKGGERYVIIGSYKNNEDTQLESDNPTQVIQNYLFIDDISVIEFDIFPDTVLICAENIVLSGEFYGEDFKWNTNEISSEIIVNQSGKYYAEVEYNGCIMSDTTMVIAIDEIETFDVVDTICQGNHFEINAMLSGNYTWQDSSEAASLVINDGGFYTLSIENECGVFDFTYEMITESCNCKAHVPNAFTPNNDHVNDVFEYFINCKQTYHFQYFMVYNRWGESVFFSNTEGDYWDGNYKNKTASAGTYIWVLEYEISTPDGTIKESKRGDLLLIH